MSRVARLPVILLLTLGCNASDQVAPEKPHASRTVVNDPRFMTTGCWDSRPQTTDAPAAPDPINDCPVSTEDTPAEVTYLNAISESSGSYYPDFDGQNITFDDVAGSSYSSSVCPDVLMNVAFKKIIAGGIERFQTIGNAYKLGPLEPLSDGFERATYQLPDQYVYSHSGGYYAFGGTVSVVCVHGRFSFVRAIFAGYVDASAFIFYNYNGTIRAAGTSGTGFTSGWAYYDDASGFSNGSSDGWQAALNTYVSAGTCTLGWDIYIDDRPVCKDGHHVDQT